MAWLTQVRKTNNICQTCFQPTQHKRNPFVTWQASGDVWTHLCTCFHYLCGCRLVNVQLHSLPLVRVFMFMCVPAFISCTRFAAERTLIHNSLDLLWHFCRCSFSARSSVDSLQRRAASVHIERLIKKNDSPSVSLLHSENTYTFKTFIRMAKSTARCFFLLCIPLTLKKLAYPLHDEPF